MGQYIELIATAVISVVVGVFGFFLKRTITRTDRNRDEIGAIREDYTPKRAHEKSCDELRADIKQIKDDYITKEDFYREQSKTDRKLDRIMDILLEMKGERSNDK